MLFIPQFLHLTVGSNKHTLSNVTVSIKKNQCLKNGWSTWHIAVAVSIYYKEVFEFLLTPEGGD